MKLRNRRGGFGAARAAFGGASCNGGQTELAPFCEQMEARVHFSVVTLTADTTKVLRLHSGETIVGNGHKVGGLVGYNVSNVSVSDLQVVGKRGSGIDITSDQPGVSGLSLNNVSVSGFSSGYGVVIGTYGNGTYADIDLSDVTAYNNGIAGISTYGVKGSITQVSITHCTAYDNAGISGSNSPSGSGIMLAGLDGATVQWCEAYGNGANNDSVSGPVGIWAYDSNNVLIDACNSHNNLTRRNDGGGFDLDGGVTNSMVINSQASGNAGYGFAAFTYAGSTANDGNAFLNNISVGDSKSFMYWSGGPTISDLTVSGNQFETPISGFAIIGGKGSDYLAIQIASSNAISAGASTWLG